MATPIVFDNAPYSPGFWGFATPTGTAGEFSVVPEQFSASTLNGTVSVPGDSVQFFRRSNVLNLIATQYDNGQSIVLSDGGGFYIFSNTLLPQNSVVLYSESTLGNFAPVCFTTGTLIRTARGEVAVEDLRVGDLAVTASGLLRPITWIGNRDLDGEGPALPHDQQPVRIRAGAFGPGLPARDLRLSHGHPVLVGADANSEGGALVPVMCLINGTSIVREAATRVTYWHVELDVHDILFAEGLAAESYYDMGNRVWFAGADGPLTDPDFVPASAYGRCRPVAVDGAPVEAERRRLDALFAGTLAAQCKWNAAGYEPRMS